MKTKFVKRMSPADNATFDNANIQQQKWITSHWDRTMVYSPWFDKHLSWYPNAWVYFDLYAIYKDSPLATQHPEWILKDEAGASLYIPYRDSNGTVRQYAADISNPAYRRWWIEHARELISKGYKGLWIDDVNMNFSVSDGALTTKAPFDPNTGTRMTWDNWRRYMCDFVTEVCRAVDCEILHNSVWYAGASDVRDLDYYIQKQISRANFINVERGVVDGGLRGGVGEWSLRTLLSFIGRVPGICVMDCVASPSTEQERQYNLACALLTNSWVGDQSMTPDNWWPGYDVDLGSPLGYGYYEYCIRNGLLYRHFEYGEVWVNGPEASVVTVAVPSNMRPMLGNYKQASVSLPTKSAAILVSRNF